MKKIYKKSNSVLLMVIVTVQIIFNGSGIEASLKPALEQQTTGGSIQEILNIEEYIEQKQEENFVENVQMMLSDDDLQREYSTSEYDDEFQTGRIIVKSEKYIEDTNAKKCVRGYNDLYIFQYDTPKEASDAYERFLNKDDVIFVQADRMVCIEDAADNSEGSEEVPEENWGLPFMKFPEYEEFLKGMDAEFTDDIVVAIVDTGLKESCNNVFENRVLQGNCFINIDEITEKDSVDSNSTESNYTDDNGHGTSVAGILAQATPDNVKILPIKSLNWKGRGSELAVYTGILYALQKEADVINLSCGAEGECYLYTEIMAEAERLGVPVVVAAGNERQSVLKLSPASIPSVITVTSINKELAFSYFSNYGDTVDFTAPGEKVAVINYKGGYKIDSGTSYSTPLITASIAYLLCANPDYKSSEIFNVLKDNAVDLGDEGWDGRFGYGWIDMAALEDDVTCYLVDANGDANNDGVVDISDALYVLKTVSGEENMDDVQKARVGVKKYDSVNTSHALAIMKLIVGMAETYYIQ